MTREEVKERVLGVFNVDEDDYDEECCISDFCDEEEMDELRQKLGDEFNVDVESMDYDEKLSVIIDGLCTQFGIE